MPLSERDRRYRSSLAQLYRLFCHRDSDSSFDASCDIDDDALEEELEELESELA